tara:strand:+ start:651 stop:923 length:273 start_codon:yes stop_codon:yes gene_type:complete
MKVKDLHNIAEEKGILWDDDPVFKIVCKQLTGEEHLDNMSSLELQRVYEEITTNPAVFSKNQDNFLLKKNYDYDSGDFLDRIRSRKKGLS